MGVPFYPPRPPRPAPTLTGRFSFLPTLAPQSDLVYYNAFSYMRLPKRLPFTGDTPVWSFAPMVLVLRRWRSLLTDYFELLTTGPSQTFYLGDSPSPPDDASLKAASVCVSRFQDSSRDVFPRKCFGSRPRIMCCTAPPSFQPPCSSTIEASLTIFTLILVFGLSCFGPSPTDQQAHLQSQRCPVFFIGCQFHPLLSFFCQPRVPPLHRVHAPPFLC